MKPLMLALLVLCGCDAPASSRSCGKYNIDGTTCVVCAYNSPAVSCDWNSVRQPPEYWQEDIFNLRRRIAKLCDQRKKEKRNYYTHQDNYCVDHYDQTEEQIRREYR
jgi:hypothetical protein